MQGRYHYHSTLRSIRGSVIFYTDADRLLFLNIFRRFTDKYNIIVVEFVIMDNHIHILYTAESFIQANRFIGELQQNFSFWYNRFHFSKDKLFTPAKVCPKFTQEEILKCSFYILQIPMVACPEDYPHPKDYKWSSYHFHYDFSNETTRTVKLMKDVSKANMMFDIINNSRSKVKNKCPELRSGFIWPDVRLSDFMEISTSNLDCLYTKREFKVIVQKFLIFSSDFEK